MVVAEASGLVRVIGVNLVGLIRGVNTYVAAETAGEMGRVGALLKSGQLAKHWRGSGKPAAFPTGAKDVGSSLLLILLVNCPIPSGTSDFVRPIPTEVCGCCEFTSRINSDEAPPILGRVRRQERAVAIAECRIAEHVARRHQFGIATALVGAMAARGGRLRRF